MQWIQLGENDRLKRRVYLHLVDASDGITPETGEVGGSAKISINGATPTTSINKLVAVDTVEQPGTYYLELVGSELKDLGFVTVRYKSSETAEFVQLIQIIAFDPYMPHYSVGGAGDIDYTRIKKMVHDSIATIPKPVQPKEVDFSPLSDALEALLLEIRGIDIPKPERVNLDPILSKLESVHRSINAIKIPETDLSPVMERLDQLPEEMESAMNGAKNNADELINRMKDFFVKDMDQIKESINELNQKYDNTQAVIVSQKQQKEPKSQNVLKDFLNL